jgi:hypothetical protein
MPPAGRATAANTPMGPALATSRLSTLVFPYLKASLPLLAFLAGAVALLEMGHHLNSAAVGEVRIGWQGAELDLLGPLPWTLAGILMFLGGYGLWRLTPTVRAAWDDANRPLEPTA